MQGGPTRPAFCGPSAGRAYARRASRIATPRKK